MRFVPRSLSGFALLTALAGCGASGPDIASVEGVITLDGAPLPGAAVVFIPEGGRPAGATTDSNGRYVLNFTEGRKGAIPGKNRVLVTTRRDPWEDETGKSYPGSGEKLPVKYNARSELSFHVVDAQANVANFDLDSKGVVLRSADASPQTLKPFASR